MQPRPFRPRSGTGFAQRVARGEELARGYVFGRAMWSGPNITLEGILQIADGLLHDEESPWRPLRKEGEAAGGKR